MAQSYRKIEAVTKSLEILEFLAKQKDPVSGPEIARAIGLPIGTVMCHLSTLGEKDFVSNDGSCFELGMAAALVWARKKAALEHKRDSVNHDINTLGGAV